MYTDAFGNYTLPPSEYGYDSFILTGNATFVWPYNTDSSPYPVAKVMDFTCQAGNIVTLPNATEVSTGEDFLIRNVGANPLTVHNANGVQIATVAIGAASYFYLTDNTTAAGVYGVIGFGVGTSTADAASLVGYGIKAVGASLNQAHPVFPSNTGLTFDTDHRAKLIVFTGGTGTFALTAAATLGDDYFTMFRNEGTGTATIDPASSELIDGMGSLQVQPGESLMLICTGTQWYSVGYGRSTLYQFTQLTKDVSAGGTITLTAAEASNKLITFIGNPTGAVNVVVPSIVAVYYTQSAISTAHTVTLKTASGSGTGIDQGARIIALCDGTNVVSAQSAVANTSVSLADGSVAVPSLYFATKTNTGLYKSGTQDLGVAVNGAVVGVFGSTGLQTTTIGANSAQRHALPAVSSDTVALLAATQTLTNKTFTSPTITGAALTGGTINNTPIGGTTPAAGAFTNLTTTGTIDLGNAADTTLARSAAGVLTIEGVEAVTLSRTQTLTNKTINLGSNTVSGTLAQFNTAVTDADFASLAGSETLTNKTINLTSNTLSGTTAQFNAALSDNDFATLAGSETLTNKTITAPAITGGSINNTPIGGTTPAAGAFTTLSANGNTTLGDASTDTVTVNGYMGVGGAGNAVAGVYVKSSALSGASQFGTVSEPVGTVGATTRIVGFASGPTTAASATTNSNIGFWAQDVAKGAGSTITNQYGALFEDQTQGTNNYGITSLVSSGTNKWNIYASGTAANYFAGNVGIGTTAAQKFHVNSGVANNVALFESTDGTALAVFKDNTTTLDVGVGAIGDNLVLVNNTERLRIDSSGNVGIGTISPGAKLDVTDTSSGAVTTALLLRNPVSSVSGTGTKIYFSCVADNNRGSYIQSASLGASNETYLAFATNSAGADATERLRIDSSGNVGIGTITATDTLTVKGAISRTYVSPGASGSPVDEPLLSYRANSTDVIAEITGRNTLSSNYSGALIFKTRVAGGSLVEAMQINSSGNIGLGVTPTSRNNTTLQIKDGIGFPATQVASSDANTLDDYREGTFTPTIVGTTVAGTGTYTTQLGRYTKIGRLVTVNISVAWTAHTGTGNMRISGIPFAAGASSGNEWLCVPEFTNMAMPVSTIPIGLIVGGSSQVYIYSQAVGSGSLSQLVMDSAAGIYLSITYEASI